MGIADKTYYEDAEGNVTDDVTKAATILINKGQEIPAYVAERIGKVAPESEAVIEDADDAPVKSAKPSANKSAAPTKNKGVK